MRLHQLKLEFSAEHDRLLLRLATDSGAEVLLWLTRRCVKSLWPVLLSMAEAKPEIALQPNPDARKALFSLEHEKALAQADFSKPYQELPRALPLGPEPLLVNRIQPRLDSDGRHVLGLLPQKGQGVHVTFDEGLLHGLVKLLQNAVAKADWDLALGLPDPTGVTMSAAEGGRPTIN